MTRIETWFNKKYSMPNNHRRNNTRKTASVVVAPALRPGSTWKAPVEVVLASIHDGALEMAPSRSAARAIRIAPTTMLGLLLGLLLIAAGNISPAFAQPPTTQPAPATANPRDDLQAIRDQIQQLRTQLASPDVSEEDRNRLDAALTSVEARLSNILEFRSSASRDRKTTETIDQTAQSLEQQLAQAQQLAARPFPSDGKIEDLEDAIRLQKQKVEQLQKELNDLEARLSQRPTRRQELRMRLLEIADQESQIAEEAKTLAQGEPNLENQVRRLELDTLQLSLAAERAAIESELNRMEAEESKSILRRRRDLTNRLLEVGKKQIELWEADLADRRRKLAEQAAQAAQQQEKAVLEKHPILATAYARNTELAEELKKIEMEAAAAKAELNRVLEQSTTVAGLYRDAKLKVDAVGLSSSIGAMLRKRKDELPGLLSLRLQLQSIRKKIDDLQLRSFDIDQQLEELSLDSIREEILEAALADEPPDRVSQRREEILKELDSIPDELERLKEARLERLEQLDDALDRYGEILWDYELALSRLIQIANEFREYINERILWIRSNPPLFSEWSIDETDRKAFDPTQWKDVAIQTWQLLRRMPLPFFLVALTSLLLISFKPRIRKRIDDLGREALRRTCDSIWPTLKALGLSILLTLAIPVVPMAFGLAIVYGETPGDNPVFLAFGQALLAVAWFSIPLEFARRMCRPYGLAHSHFDWNDQAVQVLRNNLSWASLLGSALVFVAVFFKSLNPKHEVDLIERVVFVAGMACVVWFIHRVFHPQHGIWSEYLKRNNRSWAAQLSGLWFYGMLAVPIGLAALTVLGYYFTALNLVNCAYATMVFAIAVETLRALIARFILTGRRHRHIQTLIRRREAERKKREAERAEAAGTADAKGPTKAVAELVESGDMDTMEIDESARHATKLLSISMALVWLVGMWVIWTEVLPAVKRLDQYTLWTSAVAPAETTDNVSAAPPASSGASGAPTENGSSANTDAATMTLTQNEDGRVTLRDLLLAVIITVVTVVTARNLPGALEMFLLEQMPFDRTMRFAIKSLISYGIVMVGVIFAFRTIHISWSNVQWLATALTFGLAFGLQEIFANFVAGIILMFERPMRLGDWVTVDDHTGVVTRIRTRATTITTLDRKEYVVPNKDLITGRLVNWTLSDTLNRIDVKVGVAYGSDMETAKRLLLEIAQQSKYVVNDPPPTVAFDLFGDNSLNLTLRGFLPSIDDRVPAIDELHTEINRRFADARIEIAFPQRDLHLRSVDPSVEKVLEKLRRAGRGREKKGADADDK